MKNIIAIVQLKNIATHKDLSDALAHAGRASLARREANAISVVVSDTSKRTRKTEIYAPLPGETVEDKRAIEIASHIKALGKLSVNILAMLLSSAVAAAEAAEATEAIISGKAVKAAKAA